MHPVQSSSGPVPWILCGARPGGAPGSPTAEISAVEHGGKVGTEAENNVVGAQHRSVLVRVGARTEGKLQCF